MQSGLIRKAESAKTICFVFGMIISGTAPICAYGSANIPKLEAAQNDVLEKRYSDAIALTQPLLNSLLLNTVEEIILAHRILGVAYCELGNQEKASTHFESLVTFSPNETIDDLVSSESCSSLLTSVKGGKVRPRWTSPPAPLKPAVISLRKEEASKGEGLTSSFASSNPYVGLRLLPFGIGQFANGQRNKGMAFLATEITAGALATTSWLLFQSQKEDGGDFHDASSAATYRGLFWGSFGVGALGAVWGVIDSLLVFHKQAEIKRAKGLRVKGSSVVVKF